MQTISILTPARKRPENIFRMLNSIRETISGENNVEVIFRVDDTDADLIDPSFMEAVYQMTDVRLYPHFIVGPETFPDLGILWNDCFDFSTGDILQMGGDDLIYETKNWDKKIVETFAKYPDRIALVWAKDGGHDSSLATHGFVSRRWVETIGWFAPRCGATYANDDFIYQVGRDVNRLVFLCDVSIKHIRHFDGSESDPNYGRMMSYFDKSQEILMGKIGRTIIEEAVQKLRSALNK